MELKQKYETDEIEALREFFERFGDGWDGKGQVLTLVFLGEKRGCGFELPSDRIEDKPEIERMLGALPLEYDCYDDPESDDKTYFISRSERDLIDLRSRLFESQTDDERDRAKGEFFGYPDEALNFFNPPNRGWAEWSDWVVGWVQSEEIPVEDCLHREWVYYTPAPTPQSTRRAFRTGKRRKRYLRAFANEHDLDDLHQTLDTVESIGRQRWTELNGRL